MRAGIQPSPQENTLRSFSPLERGAERYERLKDRIPLGRVGKPADLVGTAVSLASAASDDMTGHILTVDGGWLASCAPCS